MHGFANPARFLRIARWLTPALLLSGLVLTAAALLYGLFYAPAERLQGETVRIIFLHIPTVWLGMAGWTAIAVASFVELVWRHPLAGIAARGAAVPGAVFTALGLATGSILVLLFLYLGYIALADSIDREGGSSRIPAIFGLVGAVNIPIIHFSVTWWNSLHQPPSLTTGGSAMAGPFLWGVLASVLGFSLLFGGVVLARMRTILARVQAEARLRRKALES